MFGATASYPANGADETTYYSDEGVRITQTRFIVGGATYAKTSVASVTLIQVRTNRSYPWVLAIGATLLVSGYVLNIPYVGDVFGFAGLVMIATGVIMAVSSGRWYEVVLGGSFGHVCALRTHDKSHCERILDAWNRSLVEQ